MVHELPGCAAAVTEANSYTYLSLTCRGITLDAIERSHPALLAIADQCREFDWGCSLLIHICDVSDRWKQEHELL